MPTPSKAAKRTSSGAMQIGLAVLTQPVQAVSGRGDVNEVIQEGWLLKKRRKKMQGFARRYFVLRKTGIMSYSYQQGGATRDQIAMADASLSSSATRKDIHIDSGLATFHIKALKQEDFDKWMSALRKFVGGSDLARKPSVGRTMTVSIGKAVKAGVILHEMGQTIEDLETAVAALKVEEARRKLSGSKSKKEKGPIDRDSVKEKGEHGPGIFGLFSRSKGAPPTPPSSNMDIKALGTDTPLPSPPLPAEVSLDHLESLLHTLHTQYRLVSQSFPTFSTLDSTTSGPIVEEPEEDAAEADDTQTILLTDRSGPPTRTLSTSTRQTSGEHRRRVSTSTFVSLTGSTSGSSQWFDAYDGGEEFILDDDGDKEGEIDHSAVVSEADMGSDKESIGSDDDNPKPPSKTPEGETTPQASHFLVKRRSILPAPTSGDEVSLFSVLKKNVGKDLSTVSLPVTFNEPLSLLQRLGEDMEYYQLLDEAVASGDPVERLCLVAAFAVSGYVCTRFRSGRKPFNPMLGETFEDVRMKFISEKVSHNPVVLAMHAQGAGWEYWGTSGGKNKFWGKSLEIIPTGTTHVKIGEDHYQWQKPSSFMRNLIAGNKYLEHVGLLTVVNVSNGFKCDLEFKETGFWGGSPNVVSGAVIDPSGKVQTRVEGAWHEQLSIAVDPSHLRVLWRANTFPQHAREYYGFTSWATTLNEVTPDLEGRLPATDSRLRPDQRALENGDVPEAELQKQRVEERQRQRRVNYDEVKPRWFKKVGGDGPDQEWEYAGGYWETRTKGWKDVSNLW